MAPGQRGWIPACLEPQGLPQPGLHLSLLRASQKCCKLDRRGGGFAVPLQLSLQQTTPQIPAMSVDLHSRAPALGDGMQRWKRVLHFLIIPLLTRDRGHQAQTSAGSASIASTGQIPLEWGDCRVSMELKGKFKKKREFLMNFKWQPAGPTPCFIATSPGPV